MGLEKEFKKATGKEAAENIEEFRKWLKKRNVEKPKDKYPDLRKKAIDHDFES